MSVEQDKIKPLIHLLDYGAGNVRSVRNAIKYLGYSVSDITSPDQLYSPEVTKLVFPGVGHFSKCIKFIEEHKFRKPLTDYLKSGRGFLGICVGLQALFEGSEETENSEVVRMKKVVESFGEVDLEGMKLEGMSEEENEKIKVSLRKIKEMIVYDKGLGIIPAKVKLIPASAGVSVPHIGWNGLNIKKSSRLFNDFDPESERVYFVHSYCAQLDEEGKNNAALKDWVLTTTNYGVEFISAVQKGNIMATQFHPEKSGSTGLKILKNFLSLDIDPSLFIHQNKIFKPVGLSKRVIACLDVRRNELNKLIVTKGLSYDVHEKDENGSEGKKVVRNVGCPVSLSSKYFNDGCDELSFLSIMSFADDILKDNPLQSLLEEVSLNVFVPLTIGGGIRDYVNAETNQTITALEIASMLFRSGADKVSIGSEAVKCVKDYLDNNMIKTGRSCLEQISDVYGKQAVVVSVDPKRFYLDDLDALEVELEFEEDRETKTDAARKNSLGGRSGSILFVTDLRKDSKTFGEKVPCIYLCTVKGGRELTDLDVQLFVQCVEQLGAGEILLNCIDHDGQGLGFDEELIKSVCELTSLPVIASSGAGDKKHFETLFKNTRAEAGLAAGMFHRNEETIQGVKKHLHESDIPIRLN